MTPTGVIRHCDKVTSEGDRLGLFGQATTVTRLIIEYGSHDAPSDLACIDAPGFYARAGRATAHAFAAFLGVPLSGTP